MEFSEDWKTPWTISTVFSAPKLLRSGSAASPSSASNFGPLKFSPGATYIVASSPSFASPVNPPVPRNVLLDDLLSYFRSVTDDFVPVSLQNELIPSLFPPNEEDPIPTNRLHGLLFRGGTTLALFFPRGENAHHIGYVMLNLTGLVPKVLEYDGERVFDVGAGYRHPYHRITQIAVNPADADSEGNAVYAIEGYILATTLYSVSWFKMESSQLCHGGFVKRPHVSPMGKQGFQTPVIYACWNPHFKEQMVVLLENGTLVHMDVESKAGASFDVHTGVKSDTFLSCAFGGQPWFLMVASATAVVMVDLRSQNGDTPVVLAKTRDLTYFTAPVDIKNDRFIGFCRSNFDHHYFSVFTDNQLVLYDVRQPQHPLLAWDHGMRHPSHASMHKLSEIRPSEKFSWASDTGYAILLGSFWNDKFKLFHYGPRSEGVSDASSFYAWELPYSISLSGRRCSSAADALKDDYTRDRDQTAVPWQMKQEIMLGLYIDPRNFLEFQPDSNDNEGFGLIRIMSSGKLEFQKYSPSLEQVIRKSSRKRMLTEVPDLPHHYWDYDEVLPRPLYYFKINFLSAYIDGYLFEAVTKGLDDPRSYGTRNKGLACKHELLELVNNKLRPTATCSLAEALAEISFPSSIHDIAMRRTLSCLSSDLLYLAFSNHEEIFVDPSFRCEFFEAPQVLDGTRLPQYFTRKPSRKVIVCKAPANSLVGPALPVPVLLTLERALHGNKVEALQNCHEDNLLSWNCRLIHEEILCEIVKLKKYNPDLHHDSQETVKKTPFFIYESPNESSLKSNAAVTTNQCCTLVDTVPKDENFSTFVSPSFASDNRILSEKVSGDDLFDDSNQFKLDYESQEINLSTEESKIFLSLKRQFENWRRTLPTDK